MKTSRVESLERRVFLNAAIEVWAGNTDLRGSGNDWDTFLNIHEQGYTKIGESNAAYSTTAFTGSGNFKYFVIATSGRVEVDAIRNSAGNYVGQTYLQANVDDVGSVTGAPDGLFGAIGTATTQQNYAGYLLLIASGSWQGLTLTVGDVEPMFRFWADSDRMYIGGNQTSYGVHADVNLQHNGLIDSARVHTPAGLWFDLYNDEGDEHQLAREKFFTSEAEAEQEMGEGTYTLLIQTPVGERTYELNATGVSFPTQIPSIVQLTHGGTNVPTSFTPTVRAITDSTIGSVSLEILDQNENDIYDAYIQPGETLPSVNLGAGESYLADLDATTGIWHTNELGQEFGYSKGNETSIVFGTSGFVQSTPDIVANSISAAPQTVNPGDLLTLTISVSATGGMAYSPTQPVKHRIGLSQNMIVGDADDVILFMPAEGGHPAGWTTGGEMPVRVPETALPGQYYVFGQLDDTNVVAETNESNNTGWSSSAVVTIAPQAITFDPGTKVLSIAGTAGTDTITVELDALTIHATIGGITRYFVKSEVAGIFVGGAAGNDTITIGDGLSPATVRGGDGADTLIGGNGNDLFYGDEGNDNIVGNDGVDTVFGNFGDDVIAGGLKRDSLLGGLGNDVITGGDGPDSVYGGDGTDVLRGGKGADWIEGRGKSDTIYGGLSDDLLFGGAGADMILGEDGNDQLDASPSAAFRDTLDGGLGTDLGRYDADDFFSSIEGLLA